MRRISVCFLLVTAFLFGRASLALTQEKAADKAPASGFRAEFLEDVAYYEQRYTRLAEAMPADKYSWRPADGVRSVGEIYTHIISANYVVARALGAPPLAGRAAVLPRTVEACWLGTAQLIVRARNLIYMAI